MTGVCLLGQIVNNCVTDNAKLPLSAAQGKVLMDLYNVLNTNQQNKISQGSYATLECIELASRTPFIDFHYNNSADDYTSRIIETNKGVLDVIGLLKNNGNSVATCSNDTVTFTNKGGHLLAKIGSVDIGCVPTVPEHTLNFIWNASLKRLYVNMDESQIGYLNILQ